MRTLLYGGLAAAAIATLTPSARAQQGRYSGRTTVSRAQLSLEREASDLRPYRSRTTGMSAYGEYRRAQPEPPVRREPPRAEPVHRNYFPGMPVGYGPNHNAINPAHLCVPGRRAFLVGR